jgi:hypothetical protein
MLIVCRWRCSRRLKAAVQELQRNCIVKMRSGMLCVVYMVSTVLAGLHRFLISHSLPAVWRGCHRGLRNSVDPAAGNSPPPHLGCLARTISAKHAIAGREQISRSRASLFPFSAANRNEVLWVIESVGIRYLGMNMSDCSPQDHD